MRNILNIIFAIIAIVLLLGAGLTTRLLNTLLVFLVKVNLRTNELIAEQMMLLEFSKEGDE